MGALYPITMVEYANIPSACRRAVKLAKMDRLRSAFKRFASGFMALLLTTYPSSFDGILLKEIFVIV